MSSIKEGNGEENSEIREKLQKLRKGKRASQQKKELHQIPLQVR